MSQIASRTFTNAFDDVRTICRDQNKDRYTDGFLINLGAIVHGEIQDEFARRDIAFGETVDKASFSYTAAVAPLATTAAAIAANVATFTFGVDPTITPYFFAVGDLVYITGFTGADTVFNGAFPIVTVNSGLKQITVAITHGNISAATNGTAQLQQIINVSPNVVDMYEPLEVWQRLDATQEWEWVPKVDRLDADPVVSYNHLQAYEWSDGVIKVNACSNNMLIMVRYTRQLAYPVASSTLSVEGFYYPLVRGVAREAFWATKRYSEGDRQDLKYKETLEGAILRAKRASQGVPRRMGMYRSVGPSGPMIVTSK